jgi:hypothetical protein
MQFGGGIGIYKEDWEGIDEYYKRLINNRIVMLEYIMRCSTTTFNKYQRTQIICKDDIIKELTEERERMRVRVCDIQRDKGE